VSAILRGVFRDVNGEIESVMILEDWLAVAALRIFAGFAGFA
jgi:hypothetical protein